MTKDLYIVHCIDTEGPMHESILETFKRIDSIFNIKIEPSKENLKKLQEKKTNLNGLENQIYNLVSEKRISFNSNWKDIR